MDCEPALLALRVEQAVSRPWTVGNGPELARRAEHELCSSDSIYRPSSPQTVHKILDIFEGTQQIQQLIVARRVLGKTSAELK